MNKEKMSTEMLHDLGYIKYYFDNKNVIFIKKDGIIADEEIVSIIHFDLEHKTMLKYITQIDTVNQEESKALLKAEKELGWEE